MKSSLKIGLVQEGPVYLDLPASVLRACNYIQRAASEGAEIVVFPESWLSGYPFWVDSAPGVASWDHEPSKEAFRLMHASGVSIPGPEVEAIGQAAKDHGVLVVMGANETPATGPGNGSIYNALLIFDSSGELVIHHRKLLPTHGERLVHTPGDAQGLRAIDWQGIRLGGLICWEHWMPLTRQAMHEQGEHLHLALWPQVKEISRLTSRHYAFEGRCFVLAVGARMHQNDLPQDFLLDFEQPEEWILKGGSALYAPNGDLLFGPLGPETDFAMIEIDDLAMTVRERMALDTSGHYHHRNVFGFQVDRDRR